MVATPTGQAKVRAKAKDPVWFVPASIRAEHAEAGDPLPRRVGPGPDNPLGARALYLGTTLYGTLLLAWMRFGWSSRIALYISAGLIGVMTISFGFLAPFWNFLQNVTFGSVAFTVFSGAVLAAGIAAIAKFAPAKWVNI